MNPEVIFYYKYHTYTISFLIGILKIRRKNLKHLDRRI